MLSVFSVKIVRAKAYRTFGLVLGLSLVLASLPLLRAESDPQGTDPQLVIAASSSRLAGGTANLDVNPLRRAGDSYVGEYQIKVIPYFFKNEKGQLHIDVSPTQLQKMLGGTITSFTGLAQAKGSEITHKISAKATPSQDGRGALTFTVATDSGPLVFDTSYQILSQ